MERIISDEEKIRKAIEISKRRNSNSYNNIPRANINEKKDYKHNVLTLEEVLTFFQDNIKLL